ncbi:MAG: type I-E CRISPR-associated endonuclease Cas1e [Candidatus Rokuibacteriota bacterium]
MSGLDDLHVLPKVRDSWSYLYVEHCRIDREDRAIAVHDERGKVPVPCATLALLMLGPGTRITHAAVQTCAESGCLIAWVGEEGVRFYAQGLGETRSAENLMIQARLWADPVMHQAVVIRMYRQRFPDPIDDTLTLQQIRGKEGIRVRETYARAARETGVTWKGRSYRREQWDAADSLNKALSCANSCLYGLCHAAIVSAGYSPALGFIHVGKMLSFVYDVADLYKTDVTIPVAFREAAAGAAQLERRVRMACRDAFREARLLGRIIPDIAAVLGITDQDVEAARRRVDEDPGLPGPLWDPHGDVEGGQNQADHGGGPAPGT